MQFIDDEGNIHTNMKYQNKEGISLNYTSNDIHTKLVKEVIVEAIKLLEKDRWSSYIKIQKAVAFLKENFNIEDDTNGR